MKRSSLTILFKEMNQSGTRYLVAGGLAVVAHGYLRLTIDVDLIIDLKPENVARALTALRTLGYKPTAPVDLDSFADPNHRSRWISEKGMVVFQVASDLHPTAPVDIFVEEPFDFSAVYERAPIREVSEGVQIRVVPLEELLVMKERANRPKDQIDLFYLRKIHFERTPHD